MGPVWAGELPLAFSSELLRWPNLIFLLFLYFFGDLQILFQMIFFFKSKCFVKTIPFAYSLLISIYISLFVLYIFLYICLFIFCTEWNNPFICIWLPGKFVSLQATLLVGAAILWHRRRYRGQWDKNTLHWHCCSYIYIC